MVPLGSGAYRKVKDYMLTRYACYLIAQNGDPKKENNVEEKDPQCGEKPCNYLCETNAWFSLPSPIFIYKPGSPTAHSAHNVYSKPSNSLQTLPPNPGYLPYIH